MNFKISTIIVNPSSAEFLKIYQLLQVKVLMVGHGGSSAGSYLTDPTSPIPSHCASIVATSTLRVKYSFEKIVKRNINIPVHKLNEKVLITSVKQSHHIIKYKTVKRNVNTGTSFLRACFVQTNQEHPYLQEDISVLAIICCIGVRFTTFCSSA